MIKHFSPRTILKLIRYWPPFLASGISVKDINEDFTEITAQMVQKRFNTNYVGTHFGGSLYSMCDPFYMFILLHHLKDDHIVWDQSAKIDFKRPGLGTVTASFTIPQTQISQIKDHAMMHFSSSHVFHTAVLDSSGKTVAEVEKTLYIRRKDAKERFKNQK